MGNPGGELGNRAARDLGKLIRHHGELGDHARLGGSVGNPLDHDLVIVDRVAIPRQRTRGGHSLLRQRAGSGRDHAAVIGHAPVLSRNDAPREIEPRAPARRQLSSASLSSSPVQYR